MPEVVLIVSLFFSIFLQSTIDCLAGAGGFDVEDYVVVFEKVGDVEVVEFAVGYGGDGGIEFDAFGQGVGQLEAVFAAYGVGVGPGVVDGDVEVVFAQGVDDVDHLGVAHIGAIFLECEAEYEDVAA